MFGRHLKKRRKVELFFNCSKHLSKLCWASKKSSGENVEIIHTFQDYDRIGPDGERRSFWTFSVRSVVCDMGLGVGG